MITPAKAYEIASQWGSFMRAGDPGAVFYSFPTADARPTSEEHRAALIEYTDSCLATARARLAKVPARHVHVKDRYAIDVEELVTLREFFAAFPLTLDKFTEGYITCALWSSNDESTESGGVPIDENYSAADLAPDTLEKMKADCAQFQAANYLVIAGAILHGGTDKEDYSEARAGHDFWLTRNGHGAGFWDRGLGPIGDQLTKAAKGFGTVDLYIGDDKKIHQS